MAFPSPCAISFTRELMDERGDWSTQLRPWLDEFSSGSAALGPVKDWRPDGSQFVRHGVVVELCVKVTKALRREPAYLKKIREAIDLVQLILAVKPTVIKSVLIPNFSAAEDKQPCKFAEELAAMARGVPVELRLEFSFLSIKSSLLKSRFLDVMMEQLDGTLSTNTTFLMVRKLLLQMLFHRPEMLKRVAHCAMHSAVSAQLVVDSTVNKNVSEADSEGFFADLAAFVTALDQYQRRDKAEEWSIVTKHAAVRVEKVALRLRRMHVTPRVVESAKQLMAAGIPVVLSRLNLDFRFISCSEEELNGFVQTITSQAAELIVDTGTMFPGNEDEDAVDRGGKDYRDRIRMVLKAVSRITNLHGVNMAEILRSCTMPQNRQAIWRGLIEDVLSRDDPFALLTFMNDVFLTDHDGVCIAECATRWREANPTKTLRVRHLELYFVEYSHIGGMRGLISAFNDLEKLTLAFDEPVDDLSRADLASFLQFPSLRSVSFSNVPIPTMDLFDPRVCDPQMPRKPVLRELHLDTVVLEDTASMSRFLQQLKQPTELTTTLRVLRVKQHSFGNGALIFGRDTVALLDEVLMTNETLSLVSISVDYGDREFMLPTMKKLKDKHSGRAVPTFDDKTQLELTKACNRAFLSTISSRQTDVGARSQLDSSLLSQIFAFTGPHDSRKISFDLANL